MSKLRNGVVVAALLAAMGCANNETDSHPEDTGTVQFALVVVPTDVQCLQITATGTRVKQQNFNVVPGQMSVLSMNGLPVGAVTFTGQAFNGPCGGPAVTYVADPGTVQINSTGVAAVPLSMRRNGQASISVDFETGNMCVPAGMLCDPTNPTSCCTGLTCQADATGKAICQQNMCPPVGAVCDPTRPDSCCSGLTCSPDATGLGVCKQVNMCVPQGLPCDPANPSSCCSGLACLADVTGKAICQQNMCVPQGGKCLAGTACCVGLSCQPDPTGIQSCQPTVCMPPGAVCGPGLTQQCCAGLMCVLDPATMKPICR